MGKDLILSHSVFLDTAYAIALASPGDEFHVARWPWPNGWKRKGRSSGPDVALIMIRGSDRVLSAVQRRWDNV
jgi:hypothetical protein